MGLAEKLVGAPRKLTGKPPRGCQRLVGTLPAGVLLKPLEKCPPGGAGEPCGEGACHQVSCKLLAAKPPRKATNHPETESKEPLLQRMSLWLPLLTKLNTVPPGPREIVHIQCHRAGRRGNACIHVQEAVPPPKSIA